ncbi:MAG: penicillin-binding transpeptidase domain-containing protein [Patescibacteria group bacterium]
MAPRLFKRSPRTGKGEIAPEDIFIDSSNLPEFNVHQFEGRIERPIAVLSSLSVLFFFIAVALIFGGRLFFLQITLGSAYALQSERNSLRHTLVFSERGVIYDRTGAKLAWNEPSATTTEFSARAYIDAPGFAHILGYVNYPSKDANGFYYQEKLEGKDGAERFYDFLLSGRNGLKITETDVFGKVESESVIELPVRGKSLTLSIDASIQKEFYSIISETVNRIPFQGGAGIMMDIQTGEIIALVSAPEYSPSVLASGDGSSIERFVSNPQKPFLNRITSGLYAPGSIVKPFLAIGALSEGIISPEKEILSTGSISIPNPYNPEKPSVFRDWKAHGWVDMRQALAVSSDVYFYEIGGGFEEQKGLGIENIEKYFRLFGLGEPTGIDLSQEESGVIPNPEWKQKTFDEEWRIGDTYNTAIGQYSVQTTPIQMVRAISAIGSGGTLVTPHIAQALKTDARKMNLPQEDFAVVREGMRRGVTEGTASGLFTPSVAIAAKTGTAELGAAKQFVNSWVVGFFPYDKPRYAFAVVMEKGPSNNLIGGVFVMRQLVDWMSEHAPEYFTVQN